MARQRLGSTDLRREKHLDVTRHIASQIPVEPERHRHEQHEQEALAAHSHVGCFCVCLRKYPSQGIKVSGAQDIIQRIDFDQSATRRVVLIGDRATNTSSSMCTRVSLFVCLHIASGSHLLIPIPIPIPLLKACLGTHDAAVVGSLDIEIAIEIDIGDTWCAGEER